MTLHDTIHVQKRIGTEKQPWYLAKCDSCNDETFIKALLSSYFEIKHYTFRKKILYRAVFSSSNILKIFFFLQYILNFTTRTVLKNC